MKLFALLGCSLLLSGCAGVPSVTVDCSDNRLITVSPVIGSADHSASAPGNQQKFTITNGPGIKPGCPAAQIISIVPGSWTSADPLNVSVSSAKDATNGTATCTGATGSAVTLTATYAVDQVNQTSTVQMSCK